MNDVPGSDVPAPPLAGGPPEAADPPSEGGWSIAEAGRDLGLAPDTLRKWQHRYGLGPSRSSSGGHRRYVHADLLRLRRVRDLIARGVATAEAARQVLQDEAIGLESSGSDPAVRRLAAAAAQLDGPSVRHLVDQELARRGVVDTWEHLLRPVLVSAGAAAERSTHAIAVEHVLSHVVHAALSSRIPPAATGTPRPTLLACAPDEEHELPMVALAAALAERGIGSTLLGARTPPAAAASFLDGLLVVFALLPQDVPEFVQDPAPGTTIVAAGPGWDPAALPPRIRHVNSLPAAIALFDGSTDATDE
jgi:DNA-binding transcriptional MerR regulator